MRFLFAALLTGLVMAGMAFAGEKREIRCSPDKIFQASCVDAVSAHSCVFTCDGRVVWPIRGFANGNAANEASLIAGEGSDDDIEQLKRDAATLRMLGGFVLLVVSLILIRVVKGWDLEPRDEGRLLSGWTREERRR